MPIPNIRQPELLCITDSLRLRKFDGQFLFALSWYQDPELVYLVDGVREAYTREKLTRMYRCLNDRGELYFIEIREENTWKPIGDVTFWQEDMPIVIGDPAYRGRGIGTQVVSALVRRGWELGYRHLFVEEIYEWNPASRRCFESAGFQFWTKTEKGAKCQVENPNIPGKPGLLEIE